MEAPISASQGAMRSLPGKLESLLSDPGKGLHKGEKNKIRALKGDLEELIAKYLVEPSEVEDPALTASSWMKEARELSYDIHDFVDDLVSVDAHAKIQQAPSPKISRFQGKHNRHQEITDQISSFRTRVKEAIQQHKDHLCNLRKWPSSSAVALDGMMLPPPPAPLEGGLPLVGMGSSIEELSGWLAKDGKPERIVASIVGVGGVGKTTLANQLYRKLGGQFQCRAFLRTTRKPDHRKLLTSILSQVRPHQPVDTWGVPNLVEKIKEYLQNKTYFIVIDDLWAPSTWDIVSRALPKGNYCTRILTTTEVEVVARICCAGNSKYIYKKKPLSEDESKKLFSNVIFFHQSDQCSKDLSKVQEEIIKKNGGLPLAIIIMASLLARHPAIIEQWNYMMSLPNSYLVKNANLEMMRHVLNLSYNNIPHYLKACMLYLSLYEEDSIILKDDLVKQWISEGFIFAMEGNDKEKVARSYFDELVNRGMIQPVDIDSSDEVLSCTVHYMVLHHIRHISIEENFITAIDHSQTATRLADKVRRLALHFGTEEDAKPPTSMRLSQVRSLAFFGSVRCMPSVMQFRFLRVLIVKLLVDPDETSYCNLSGISELFQLRYLRVDACHVNLELPTHMRWLKDLVALQIEANVSAVPSDIVNMTGLLYLNLPSEAHLPTGIGKMTSLRTLGYFDLSSNSEENVMDLGKLTNLQDLHLTCSTVQPADNLKKNMECLGLVLEKLSNLKCVTLVPAVLSDVSTHDDTGASSINVSCNILSSISPASTYLQRFELFPRFCIFRNLPNWFGEFHQLCILKIAVREISTEDIRILKALPALTALSLSVWTVPEGWIFIEEDGFPVLRYLKFTCAAPCLAFVEGAMSYVQRLILRFNANRLEQYNPADARFEHLSGLKEISVEIGGANADKLDLRAAENALLIAFKKHRSSTLIINLQWVHWIYHGDKEMGTSLEKKNYQTLPVKGVITDEQHGRKDKQVDSSLSPILMRDVESISHPQNPDVSIRDRGKGRETWGVISASLGAMGPLVAKLDKLVQVPPQGCSSESVKDLLKDVTEMKTCMHNLSEVEDPPLPAKFWMNEARDLSYRMDDYIDSLLFVQPADPSLVSGKTQTIRFFRKWFSHDKTTPKSLEWHEQVAATLSEFKEYAQDAIHRHKVYVLPNSKIESTLSHRGAVSVGPMLPKPYEEAADIVFDGRMNGFINSLANDGDKQLKVVSVLGPACLGKTTLVKVFYNKFGKLYDCRAFIRVSKNPDMKKLLHDILSQLRPQDPPEYHSEVVLIDDIKKYLQNKRYLLIVDNVWAASVWSIIKHAFPKGNLGSRIITTTQAEDVALTCCCYQSENVFEVKPLDDDHSRMLFFGRVFRYEGNCPDPLKDDSNEIVELCGGLPLTTVSIASLLASQPVVTAEQLRYIRESLGSCFSANSSSERTRQALNLSFSYLPQYLKTCLLYLSMYPEGYTFCKDDLVKQWIAECFIGATEGQDMKKVAESYIDELIHRRFIQPIRIKYYNEQEVLSFTVHDVVHDLIARKSAEEDFIVAIDYNQKNKAVFYKARRLSLLFGDARDDKIPENITKSQVRSLNFFGIYECMPTIAEYKLLRVLDLQISGYVGIPDVDLTGVSELFQLRYLKIACNGHFIILPTNGLQFLETLIIRNAKVRTFEWSLPLPQLLHLCLPLNRLLLDRIGSSRSPLGPLIVGSAGRLNNLQDLHLTVNRWYSMENNRQAIVSLIEGHANLKSIVIALESMVDLSTYPSFWFFLDDFSPPPLLQRFEWLPDTCTTFRQIPMWVGKLDNLSILKIPVWEMLMDCVDILRGLRALTALSLYVGGETESIIFDKDGFSALKFLKLRFMSDIPLIRFEEDAMPNLWKLRLVFNATPEKNQYEGVLITIDHMPSLKEISAKFGGAAADVEHGLTLVSNHESNPKLTTNNGLDASSSYYGDQSTKQKQQPDNILEEETDESTRQKEQPYEIQEEVRDEYQKKQADDFSEEEPDEYDKKLDGRADKSISRSQEASSGLHIFTLHELFSATRGWCDLELHRLNSIGFYRGHLVGDLPQGLAGQDIAIRCVENGYRGRLTELEYLGTVRHPYLVKLLGICYRKKQTLLVYEYVDRNLKTSLFRAVGSLPFTRRLHVALEAAKGLAFLHDADKPIVHGNFKASNILLDHSYTVKLCGFGLLRNHPQKHTIENDVYNFGLVLLELLTGRPRSDEYGRGSGGRGSERLDVIKLFYHKHLYEDKPSFIMDQSLEGNYSFSAAKSTAKIAFWCLESKLEERARMRDVVDALEQLLRDDNWYKDPIQATSWYKDN